MADPIGRRRLLSTVGHSALAAGVAGLAGRGAWLSLGQGAQPTAAATDAGLGRELKIGYLPITDASALLMAHQQGLFAQHGVPTAKPVLFRSWEALAQAFLVGEVDLVHLLIPFALQLRLGRQAPVKIISWGHTNGSALTVAPSIASTEQLAGTTVAIPYWWSIHSVLTQRILSAAGLTPVIRQKADKAQGTVELVVMAPAEMVSALAAGSISGYAVADPFCAVAEVRKIGRVHRFMGDVWRDHACCGIAVHDELISDHPAVVQGITDAIVEAQTWIDTHRSETATTLTTTAKFLPQPTPAVTKVLTRTAAEYAPVAHHADWNGQQLGFQAFPQASFTESLITQLRTTAIDGDTSFLSADPAAVHSQLVADSFVRTSLQSRQQAITARIEEIAP